MTPPCMLRSVPQAALVLAAALALPLATACPGGDSACRGDECAVLPAFATGTLPNDVVLSACGAQRVALVTAAGESRLLTHALPGGEVLASAVFDAGATPWAVAVTADGARAVVSLFGQDAVALVDPCTGQVLDQRNIDGQATPEPVVIVGQRAFVAFTNIESFSLDGEPPVLRPGTLAVFAIDGDQLVQDELRELPLCTNPQGLVAHDGDVIVSCSGPLAEGGDGGQQAVGDGAILIGNHVIGAGRTAPGTPTVVDGFVIVGSLVDPLMFVAALDDDALHEAMRLPGPDVDSIFDSVRWDDDTALALQFSTDEIHGLKVGRDGSLSEEKLLAVGPGGVAFRGAQALDVDPNASQGAVDAVVLLGLSAEVVPLTLRGVWP